jgi:hypothetical protein
MAVPLFRMTAHESRHRCSAVAQRVWERSQEYEDEGSERRSLGAISVGVSAWWSASLTVPKGESGVDGDVVFLHFKRHGELPHESRASTEADFSLPRSEVDAFVKLLAGLVEQARQDNVLAPRTT